MKKIALLTILMSCAPLYGLKIIVENYGKKPFKMATWYDQCHAANDIHQGQINDIKIGYNEVIAKTDGSHQCWLNKVEIYSSDNLLGGFFSKLGSKQGDSKDILSSAVYNGDLSDGVLKIVIGGDGTVYLIKNEVIFVKGVSKDPSTKYTAS